MLGDTGLKELCIIPLQFDDARMVELDVSHNNILGLLPSVTVSRRMMPYKNCL